MDGLIDEYDDLYDDSNDKIYEMIEMLRGTIERGDCLYCGGKLSMEYTGNVCFICSKCAKSVHEDVYYAWAAGYDISPDE